ncbi:MAG: OmpA family protein [Gammaproteobacteria bacterium]|nr:OmpA family protein [Gammaproteobacteria bacterium]
MMVKMSVSACFIMLLSPTWAGSQFYGANIDEAKWRTSGNRLECRLSQDIPGYGEAGFKHRALHAMEFRISSNYRPREPGQAMLFANPTVWKRYANRTLLGRVPLTTNKDTIIVPEDWAYRMALELREGMEAVWTHADFADGKDIVTAKVLPLRFEPAWRDFEECGQNLIDYSYEDVRSSTFYFTKKSMRLSASEKASLNKLAEYVSLDTDYQHIRINSHTDSRGVRRLNLSISKQRANMVKYYLINKGVDAKRFVIVARGEKKPKYNNRTSSGRAKNRRIEVKLVK